MTNEKKPSIYVDRGTIGSSEELDEYGVWVKSEPQDLSLAGVETQKTAEFSDSDISGAVDLDLSISDIGDLPDFDSLQGEVTKNAAPEDDFDLPEIDTEEESAENQPDDETFDLGDLPESTNAESEMDSLDFVSLEESADAEDEGFTEISLDNFLGTLDTEPEQAVAEELAPEEPAGDSFVDDSELSSADFSSEAAVKTERVEVVAQASTPDLSTQLLMKIAEELSSIRTELSNLKLEFSGLKAASSPPEAGENGFFGEEDDEKIALTGDELNKILNTADFTEEAGADATIDLSEELNVPEAEEPAEEIVSSDSFSEVDDTSLSLMDLDISLDETNLGELESELSGDDAVSADISGDVSEVSLPDFTDDETDELRRIREQGAEPITFAPPPEDTDYLVEDPLAESNLNVEDLSTDLPADLSGDLTEDLSVDLSADLSTDLSAESFAGDSIDLSEAVIDEPDLSAEIHDNPLEEPSLDDISISLDMSDMSLSDESETSSGELPEVDAFEEEIDIPFDIPSLEEADDDVSDIPISPEAVNTAEDEDITLIPEGFVVDAAEPNPVASGANDSLPLADEVEEEVISAESLDIPDIAEPEEIAIESVPVSNKTAAASGEIPVHLKHELKTVLSYMDQLLEALPDEKIEEFARSEYYDTYKKLFKELGLV